MKWFKHETRSMQDAKIEKLMMKYGIEGYGVYFGCLEIISGNLTSENITFELEHDVEILAYKFKIDTIRLEEIMKYCISLGLFEYNTVNNRIACNKLAKRLDNTMSQNKEIQKMINSDEFKETLNNFKSLKAEEKRKEKKRIDNNNMSSKPDKKDPIPYTLIITHLNETTGKHYKTVEKTKKLIHARWIEGYRLDDFKHVHKVKYLEWKADINFKKYLRPETLYSNKFEGYLNQEIPKNIQTEKQYCPIHRGMQLKGGSCRLCEEEKQRKELGG